MPLTPNSSLELLFPPSLIPSSIQAKLGSDLHIRPLASTDYKRGHLEVLRVLTQAPDVSADSYTSTFKHLASINAPPSSSSSPSSPTSSRSSTPPFHPATYYTIVILTLSDEIIAVGSLFIERKFLRSLGLVGHIEDIAVSEKVQGRKLGLRIIEALTGISESVGCYKTILNCSDKNIPFYEKCGYEKKENEMAKYAPERPAPARL
ncbi:acyl-CoA N-acyltransferase [Sistotremastrum suecicum HHB10207 ss-3]|uniref:Glucosamine 6-phosphate N-acetyltransferase n=1 Tax=Sistotremastrum suecicum HHB10207 ss-3 TaxID=1314776 RepID=A0A165XZ74_9AGAM|nr:acyl-CoA N-acyltransferase [Sistotremastrum suecicum HHB10207 ss-3]